MRLHRLEVEGFGPFRTRQTVDFDAFADDGIFLIAGRTGAGKSSILDAVCFGLYGGVPRYDGGEKRLRSDHCEPEDASEVVVEFSTPAGRYRVTRSPEYLRPAKRGGGMTKQAAGVALDEWTPTGWIGRAARAVDVATELDDILQLSREQFLQVILLAQNRFSEFLLAGSRDRQALLRRLFGTQRFEDVQARFDERRRRAEQSLGARLATVSARLDEGERLVVDAGWTGESPDVDAAAGEAASGQLFEPDGVFAPGGVSEPGGVSGAGSTEARSTEARIEALLRAQARGDYRAARRASERADAEQRSIDADTALSRAREDRRDQVERDRARAALADLEAEEPLIAAARKELADARSAEALRPLIAAERRARTALADAVRAEDEARSAWEELGVDVAGDLSDWASERLKQSGAWERARVLEDEAPRRAADIHAAAEAVASAEALIEERERQREALPAQILAVTAERDEARLRADRVTASEAALTAAETRRTAAHEVERLRADALAAEHALTEATTAHATAQATLAALRLRRSEGMAGELASRLVDGEPCTVCGSLEHPRPATHADPVSADDIEQAEARRDEAAQRERDTSAVCSALRADLAAAEARADGRDVDRAEAEAVSARDDHTGAVAAQDRWALLEVQLAELHEHAVRLDDERSVAVAALTAGREQHGIAVQRDADAATQIAAARGDDVSVAARLAAVEAEVEAARRFVETTAERGWREQVLVSAVEDRDSALLESVFDDAAAAEQALRSVAEQDAIDLTITRHAVQREKERGILLDLELKTLPEDPIDLAPVERASVDARAAWSTAVDEATKASGDAARLAGIIASASAEHARTAQDAADFEVLQGLADTIAGRGANSRKMTLETFVLAAELEEIVDAANRRLHDMSEGRYQLEHSDALAARGAASGLGIVVSDAFTGQTRPPQSLSGGETFLTSLALALGLAEVVTARAGGIRLDTLFIDEGFGSLDGDTLDVAMRTLDELRQGGRTVGVISHVEAMQEQIPAQLTVRALANGPSVIETR